MHKAAAHAKHGLPLRHLPAMDLPFLVLVLILSKINHIIAKCTTHKEFH